MTTLPTLFVSHGSPMRAVEPGAPGAAWRAIAQALPRPRAELMTSAPWETSVPMVTGNARPETIHDFGGFPDALYRIRYPAPGAPEVASRVVELLKQGGFAAGIDGCRGLDHGAWVPMMHMYPSHDVPVVQLAVQPGRDTAHHLAIGRALAPLAREGVLVIGSGHVTHNLRDWMANRDAREALPYGSRPAASVIRRLISARGSHLRAASHDGSQHCAHPRVLRDRDRYRQPALVRWTRPARVR